MNSPKLKTIKGCIALSLLVALQASAFPVSYQRFVRPDGRRIDVIGDMHMPLSEASEVLQEEKFCNAIKEIAAQGACTVLCEGSEEACLFTEDEVQDLFKDIPGIMSLQSQREHPNNMFLNRVCKKMVRELGNDVVKSVEIRPEILKTIISMLCSMEMLRPLELTLKSDKNVMIETLKNLAEEEYLLASPEQKKQQFPFFQGIEMVVMPNPHAHAEGDFAKYDAALGKFIENIALDRYTHFIKGRLQALKLLKDFCASKIAYEIQQKPIKAYFDEMGERLEEAKRLLRDSGFLTPLLAQACQEVTEALKKTGEQYVACVAEQNEDLKKEKFSQIQDRLLVLPFDIHALAHVVAAKTNVVLFVGALHAQRIIGGLDELGFERKGSGIYGDFSSDTWVRSATIVLGDAEADRVYQAMKQ